MALVAADQVTKKVDKTTATTNRDLGGGTCYGCAKDLLQVNKPKIGTNRPTRLLRVKKKPNSDSHVESV